MELILILILYMLQRVLHSLIWNDSNMLYPYIYFPITITLKTSATVDVSIAISKNGIAPTITYATQGLITATSGVNYNFSPSGIFSMATNDYLSVFVFTSLACSITTSYNNLNTYTF